MDASFDHNSPLREIVPGRFTRVSVQTPAGEIEARLSERGNWELRVRRDQETNWRLACTGDLDCGIVTAQPVAAVQEEVINLGALMVDPAGRRVTVAEKDVELSRKEFGLLLVLAAQPDRVFSKEELLATVWGHNGTTHTRTLDSHASRLRRRLRAAGAPGLIVNTRGWATGSGTARTSLRCRRWVLPARSHRHLARCRESSEPGSGRRHVKARFADLAGAPSG